MKDLRFRLSETEAFSPAAFQEPDALLQPAYTWVWNAPVDKEEIARQLDEMDRAGIRCVYVLPEPKEFRPHNERIHLEPEYLTEEYFEMIRFMVQYAHEKQIAVWLYDEGGWPSGGACGRVIQRHPELCRKHLDRRTVSLDDHEPYQPGADALAAFENGRMVTAGATFPRPVELCEYFVRPQESFFVDPLDDESGHAFIESTHEGYARTLSDLLTEDGYIQMMFTDEPGTDRLSWSRGLKEKFELRYGYSLLPFLPALMDGEEDGDAAAVRARIDYRELTGELFRQNYFVPIHEWCRRNRVLSTGHLDIDHKTDGCMVHNYGSPLSLLRELDVPGVDMIWRQIDPPQNGRPPYEEGNGFFPRFAASAAAQSGGKYALSESYAVASAGLTGERMHYGIHYQMARGINLFNFMISSYGAQDALPFVMRPDFRMEMPGYYHLRALNDYVARACHLMQLGTPGTRTALYFPARDIWADGSARKEAVAAFDALGRSMEARQVEFDLIDDEAVRRATLEDGALGIGLARYEHVLVPTCRHMPEDVRAILSHVDSALAPSVQCDCPQLRACSRLLPDGGRLFLLFNESGQKENMRVTLPGEGALYQLFPDTARIERAEEVHELTLAGGEARFYLRTKAVLPEAQTPSTHREIAGTIQDFTLRRVREAYVDETGLHQRAHHEAGVPCELGCWDTVLGHSFSGEAVYAAQVHLNVPARAGEIYEIDLCKVDCSARVLVNGQEAGVRWAPPFTFLLDGAAIAGQDSFLLEIEVANTLANACQARPLEEMFSLKELGMYHRKLSILEQEAPIGGLHGPVTVSRLIR